MYIREVKTTNKKTGKVYVKHVLAESVRVNGTPRPRTVMHLGRLDLPRALWPQLAAELSARLTGQQQLTLPGIKIKKSVAVAADQAMNNYYLREEQHRNKLERKTTNNETLEVKVEEIAVTHSRGLGAELVCHHIWNELRLPKLLKNLGFNALERSIAEATVIGRLIAPGSELSTWNWIRKQSSIGELTEKSLDKLGLNRLYNISDKLSDYKEEIEKHLLDRENKLHPDRDMLYLFDLTNFHFEGQCLKNDLASRGKSKQKRNDCPLVSLGLVVDSNGFPVSSKIFPGNVSEPQTLRNILEQMGLLDKDKFSAMRPALVMDRGIATTANINLLKEYGFPYILITRGPRNKDYLNEFINYKDDSEFETMMRNDKTIHIKKVVKDDDTVEVLCISEGKRHKETAIKQRWVKHASEDLNSLQRSIRSKNKGTVKKIEKIYERLGRLKERYANLTKYFEYKIIENPERPGYALDLEYSQLTVFDIDNDKTDPLAGSYVIETCFTEKNAKEIWQLYMMLTRVEAAFRSIKSDLGTRPFYHQGTKRTEGHMFISVMAYHLLCNIEYKMKQKDDHRQWQSIRSTLSTHQRSTVILTDKEDKIYHIRVSGQPEPEHKEIYEKLGIKVNKRMKKYFIAKRL